MSFQPYPKYRDSGVDWLGYVPEHWGHARLRWLSRRFAGGTPDKTNLSYWENGSIPWLNSGAVNQFLITEPSAHISEAGFANSSAKWIPAGALVMALAGQGKTKGMVAQVAIDTTCNQSMAALVPTNEAHPRFLLWWLRANYENIRNMAGGDLRDGLNLELVGDIPCPIPTLGEQSTIAGLLDEETAKIDALIFDQQRLIELLKEKRQVVISHAVTKGLNPRAPTRHSGIEWVGDMPAGWTLERLQSICTFLPGKAHEPFMSDEGEHFCVTSRFVSTGGAQVRMCASNFSPAMRGDTLMVMSDLPNGRALAKAYFVSDSRSYAVNQRVCILRPHAIVPKYLYYLVDRSPELLQHDDGWNQTHLSNADILKPRFPVPPLDEQRAIAEHLDRQTESIDDLMAEAERAIALLQERRTALISAAVTGKIDVRGLVDAVAA